MPQSVFHDGYRFLGSKERLSFDEILRITRVAANLGLRKIRITGGEPLLRPNLADLIGDLGAIEGIDDIALTTNGILLAKYATELKAAGLSRITVSLDSLDPEVFASMSGGFGGVAQVLEGIEAARAVGLTPIKINTVVQRGVNDHTVLDLIERFRGTGVIVRLIEFMDVGNRNQWDESLVVPSAELAACAWPVALADRRVKRAARIVRSCCLVCVAQLLPVAAWAAGRAAWFAVIRWPLTAARAVIRCLVNCSCCSYSLPAELVRAAWWLPSAAWSVVRVPGAGGCRPTWSRSCCLVPGPGAGGCLVAQLLPGRVCVCDPGLPVFVIRWPGSQTLGPRALVRDPWPACLAAWSVATGPRALGRK